MNQYLINLINQREILSNGFLIIDRSYPYACMHKNCYEFGQIFWTYLNILLRILTVMLFHYFLYLFFWTIISFNYVTDNVPLFHLMFQAFNIFAESVTIGLDEKNVASVTSHLRHAVSKTNTNTISLLLTCKANKKIITNKQNQLYEVRHCSPL